MGKYVKKYVPTPGHVVINPCVEPKPNAVGLILPKKDDGDVVRGRVENLWPGAEDLNLDVKRGDMVYFRTRNQIKIPYMETTMVVVIYENIIAKD